MMCDLFYLNRELFFFFAKAKENKRKGEMIRRIQSGKNKQDVFVHM